MCVCVCVFVLFLFFFFFGGGGGGAQEGVWVSRLGHITISKLISYQKIFILHGSICQAMNSKAPATVFTHSGHCSDDTWCLFESVYEGEEKKRGGGG